MERPERKLGQTLYNSLVLLLLLIIAGCGDDSGGSDISTITDAGSTPTKLKWDAPTTNVDGSDLNDLAGYNLYYKTTESDSYNDTDVVNVGDVITIGVDDISAISPGTTYDFTVTAYDTSGNESDYSNEVSVTIP